MTHSERIYRAAESTKRLFMDTDFSIAEQSISGHLKWGDELDDTQSKPLTPEDIAKLFLGKLNELTPDKHDDLNRNLADLALPIGRLCSIKLVKDVKIVNRATKISYAYLDEVTIKDSGLVPAAQTAQLTRTLSMHPALDIAGPNVDSLYFPLMTTIPATNELERHYNISWNSVRSIEVKD